jgi:polar amino acid transport system substrate-binding protein
MKNKLIVFLFLLSATWVRAAGPDTITEINISTVVWDGYTQKDGVGLYHDLFKLIFADKGIKVNVKYDPFKRCIVDLESGVCDMTPGAYKEHANDKVVLSAKLIGVDLLSVAYKTGAGKWSSDKDFEGKTVGWLRGYDFDVNGTIKGNIKKLEYDEVGTALKMLLLGRMDYMVEYKSEMEKLIAALPKPADVTVVQDVVQGKEYYMGFSVTPRGKALAQIWNDGFAELEKAGKLKELYAKYSDNAY